MTVSSTQSYIEYSGDGTTTSFTIPFYFLQNGDISALLANADGSTKELINGPDFTVTGAGNDSGGVLYTGATLSTGTTLLIYRNPPETQETKYYENGKFPAASHEAALDKLTMLIQERGWKFDSLALTKPNAFSRYYDARNNQISNVADPKNDNDAVNRKFVTGQVSAFKGYVDDKISDEADERKSADDALRESINDEVSARQDADAYIQQQLTGEAPLAASAFSPVSWHAKVIKNSVAIPDNVNAWSIGPQIAIASGQSVTVGSGSTYTVADGREVEEDDLHNVVADTIRTTDGSKTVAVSDVAKGSDLAALTDRVSTEESKVNDLAHGGTGATTAAAARTNLQAATYTGVTDASEAAAGRVGQVATNTASSISLSNGVATNISSVVLPAGDWEVSGVVQFVTAGGASPGILAVGINNTSGVFPGFQSSQVLQVSFIANATHTIASPVTRFNTSSQSTIYLVALAGFGSGTCTANGYIRARRIR